jgi:hypothetical protein
MHVWLVTVTRFTSTLHGWTPAESRTVEVAVDEATARNAVEDHGRPLGVYLDDWVVREMAGEVVSVGLEGDDVEVTATRCKVYGT